MGLKGEGTSDPFEDDDPGGEDTESTPSGGQIAQTRTNDDAESSSDLPWIFARDGIHDDRSIRQVHLQEETISLEKEFKRKLEEELGEDVPKADLREMALQTAYQTCLDEVADGLREWGYDH